MPPKVLTAGALRAWSVYGEINVKGLGSTLALLRTFNIAGIKAGKTMRSLMGTMQAAIKVTALAGFGFAALAIGTTRAFGNFDAAMTQSLAIMGNVSETMRGKMAMAAREVGKTTQFSAKQAAEGYFYLASAGMDAAQSLAAMPAVAQFAQAGMFDLATATDLSTDALSALGLKVKDPQKNLENLVHVTDVLTGANTLANATVQQFSEAITNKLGGRIRILGKDMEEATAVLASFADQGVKGRVAGQRLTIVMRDLPTQALKNAKEFRAAGIEVFDAAGKMRHMADIIEDMEEAYGKLSVKQRVAQMMMLGLNKRAADALALIIGQSDAIREYDEELRNMAGITKEVAEKQLGAFNLRMLRLKRTFADLAIEIGDHLAPMMESMAEQMREWVDSLDANQIAHNISEVFAGILRGVASVLEALGNMMINVNMSMTEFMGVGLIGFFLMGPMGFALFALIAINVKKLLALINPDKFESPLSAAEKRFEEIQKEFDETTQRIIGLKRFYQSGSSDVSLMSDSDRRLFETFQQTFTGPDGKFTAAYEHFLELLTTKQKKLADELSVASDSLLQAFLESQPMGQLLLDAAGGLRGAAEALGLQRGAGSGATRHGGRAMPDREDIAAWLPPGLVAMMGDDFMPRLLEMEKLKPEDVPTDHILTPIQESMKNGLNEMGEQASWRAKSIGRNLINGIVEGSLEMKDVLKMVLVGILNVAMGGLLGFLGIASPSKLTMGVGRNIGEGLAIGMEQTRLRVSNAAMGLGAAINGGFARTGLQSALSGPASGGVPGAMAANASARGAVTVNVKGMPRAMTPREAARDAAWQEVLRESVMKARKDGFRI